jgi:hypothetical protein
LLLLPESNQELDNKYYLDSIATMNDAQLKNISLYDTQQQRQAQAISNTRDATLAALNSYSDKVLKNTASYRSDSDVYKQFVDEYLREDPNTTLGIDDIFPIFRGFLQHAGINPTKHTRREFENRLNRIIGKCNTRKKWKGWKIAPNDEDEDDSNAMNDA